MKASMKRHALPLMFGLMVLLSGCDVTDPCEDCYAPPAPSGVYSITGDGYVEIIWSELHVHDLDGYNIYRSREEFGTYTFIGGSSDNYHVDADVTNGITYFYAVSAFDWDGNESDLSYETVHDTPRPAGEDLRIWDLDAYAGVDFSGYYQDMIHPWDDPFVDMYLLWLDGKYCVSSTDVLIGDAVYGTDIQYAGYVESLDEIDWAPNGGWSVETADTVTLYEGHGYLVWTWENHFAKFRVTRIGYDYVDIDWAYQIDEGNPELLILPGDRSEQASDLKQARETGTGYSVSGARSSRNSEHALLDRAPERGK